VRISMVLATVCLAVSPSTTLAQSQEQFDAPVSAPLPANALALSEVLVPRDKVVEMTVNALEFGFNAELERDQETAELFAEYPGLDRAILDAIRPVILKHVLADLPMLVRSTAQFYAERFSSAEIDGLVEFYGSPTGSKLIAGMFLGADFGMLMDGIDDSGQSNYTAGDVAGFTMASLRRIFPIFDDSDKAYMEKFEKTALFGKLKAALPDYLELAASAMNEPTPEMDSEMEEVIERVVTDFMAQEDGRSST
jgi:hypothetical protein